MNLSSLSKARIGVQIAIVVLALQLAVDLAGGGSPSIGVIAAFGALATCGYHLRRARREIHRATDAIDRIGHGDFEVRIVGNRERGDLARLVRVINDTADRFDVYVRDTTASMQAVVENRYNRRIQTDGLHNALLIGANTINEAAALIERRITAYNKSTAGFERAINKIVQRLAEASSGMNSMAVALEQGAAVADERTGAVASTAAEMATNVQTVAAAVTELAATAREIGEETNRSAAKAREAAAEARVTGEIVDKLNAAVERIGSVVHLINDIATQTDLLALNATIEAARAGEAGRGFAVVAQEVKTLANQTAKATEEITSEIDELRQAASSAVSAVTVIASIVAEIDQAIAHIASSIGDQTAATAEIARSVEQASDGTRDVTENIQSVSQNVAETRQLAESVLAASREVAQQGDTLASEVQSFLVSLRRGPLDALEDEKPR